MHYLIDGHNLIAKMPDISLSDPDDEVQLILRLRSWAARSKKRQITLFFDGGIPGGKNVHLSTPQVRVVFSSTGQTADALIIGRIHRLKNPPEYLLVSSDQQIIAAANGRKLPYLTSDKFAQQLAGQWQDSVPGPTITDDSPVVSDAEVADWLAAFGPVDEKAIRRRPKLIPPNVPPPPEPATTAETPSAPTPINREEPQLNAKDVDEWLSLFVGEAKPQKKGTNTQPKTAAQPPQQAKPLAKKPRPKPQTRTISAHKTWPPGKILPTEKSKFSSVTTAV
ncbi:MAG: NYN domain-containing protein [Anaerolineae bacterium]|nr:NYN domain-containing protein [Anaerolineae bacterium]